MFFQAQETCLRSVDAAWSKVFFLCRVRCGSVPLYTTKPAQAQGSRLPAMRHRSLNNFHKKWDNNKKSDLYCREVKDMSEYDQQSQGNYQSSNKDRRWQQKIPPSAGGSFLNRKLNSLLFITDTGNLSG